MREISRTKAKFRVRRKTNPDLEETVRLSIKNQAWNKIAQILSGPTRKQSAVNLFQLDKATKEGDTVVIPGKILATGNLTKKIKICALSISDLAKTRLKESKSEFTLLRKEIKDNPKAEGVKIIR